ncbi:decarboxylating 6-phosphogluconate dehydrogenase [Actinomadura nitritigenes]|uniref:Decarboxylating 6-phosphogluconate dehydrogenase n=1 Tax=Actinomadura nitritigenes TaxID=134602 RepID=A0ABS3QV04_9ACTN|nr:decarboxylating 6-phosphogluconate dehydrogenase [Actinomadura nitritigenes]MBO2437452.1 decarboxylating 6-phosphogluconate dehydrogenase [Actinomadura nitritigenes]
MELGIIGLGKMGANMAERLRRGGHTIIGYDHNADLSDVGSVEELARRLTPPRAVWVMVPAGGPTQDTVNKLGEVLDEGDLVVDGGNSHYVDDQRHGEELAAKGIAFLDCGVSGGVWGLQNGYALMVGGDDENVKRMMPIFETLKPEGEYGFVHSGKIGAGHYVKMVHNGIEYAMMQAFGEGYELIEASPLVTRVPETFLSWQEGTVIRSWLLDLLNRALKDDPELDDLRGYANDSGEGRWTVQAAVEHAVPLPAISASLFARFASRQDDSPAMRVVAALRNQFGGHAIESAKGADSPGADVEPPKL